MDIRRNLLTKSLKSIDEYSLRKICELAMLTDLEKEILARSYSRMQDERFVADFLNLSVGGLQKKKLLALKKILFFIGFTNPKKSITEEEIIRKLGELRA